VSSAAAIERWLSPTSACGHRRRQRRAARGSGGAHDRGKLAHQILVGNAVGGDRKQIFETARIEERDFRAAFDRGLADAMREQRHFVTQIRAHDQDALQPFDLGDTEPETRLRAFAPCARKSKRRKR
jgi:hypothetical protein